MKKFYYLILVFVFGSILVKAQPTHQLTILTASDGEPDDMFGNSLSISGNTAVIGAPQDDDIADNSGAVYVFERDANASWHFSAKLTVADGEDYDMFGEAVDIDGDYLVGSAFQATGITTNTGAAYVFKRNGTNWEFQQKIYADDGASGDNFGKSVAISGDYIVVGAPNEDFGTGVAYVFHRSGETWTQIAKLEESSNGEVNDNFGCSVDIYGNYIVIGAWQDNAPESNTGATYIYKNNSGIWELDVKLVPDDAQTDDETGYSVAISGNYVVSGSFNQNGARGAAYIFHNNLGSWEQQAKIQASDGSSGDYFGKNVSISGDYILIGSQRHDLSRTDEGAAYLFVKNDNSWTQTRQFTASDAGDTDMFGYYTAIDGDYALISSVQGNGKVYVFAPDGANTQNLTDNITIFPNPANSFIKVKAKNHEIKNIKLTGLSGNVIFTSTKNTIDISKLASGIYFIEVETNNGVFMQKIVKK